MPEPQINPNGSPADPWNIPNPFPEGHCAHQPFRNLVRLAKETFWLLESRLAESLPPESASPNEFLDFGVLTMAEMFDAWAGLFFKKCVLTDDAADAFEEFLNDLENSLMEQAERSRSNFIPRARFLRKTRVRLNQRKKYWVGQILRKVREHKEAGRSNAPPKGGPRRAEYGECSRAKGSERSTLAPEIRGSHTFTTGPRKQSPSE